MLLSACLTGDDELDLESVEEEVARGGIITSAASVGGVQLLNGSAFYCSGTMISPEWVLTAGHCPTTTSHRVRLGNNNDSTAQVSAIDRIVENPAMDLKLIRLKKAFNVQGRGWTYQLSLFSDPTKTLMGKTARFYGSSDDPACGGNNCSDGYLRAASIYIDKWREHNLGGIGLNGAYAVPGDSGGGLIYETAAGRELAGVLKGTFYDMLVRPDAFRQWALSYVYDRPIDLPDIWNFGGNEGHFFAVPLQDNCNATTTWDVCPGSYNYTYVASYELEANRDTLTVSSTLGTRTLTGNYTTSGTAAGPLTLTLRTDGAVRSKGIKGFTVTCNRGVEFPNPWGSPSPAGTNDLTFWDPCPGGNPWTWTAGHNFASGTNGMIGSRVLTGNGISTGTVTGEVFVSNYTPVATSGLLMTAARCQLALKCHGNTCFSRSDTNVGAPQSANVSWNPCNGGGFRYKATLGLGIGDTFRVSGGSTNESYQVNGSYSGTTGWRSAGGAVNLTLGANQWSSSKVKEVVAQCDAWGPDRSSVIQVQSATYGRNCRRNKDNVTQKLWQACRTQGGNRCDYVVNTSVLGDPAVGCAKDFTAEWTCGTSTALNRLVISGEANGRTALLWCPAS